ncbi:tetratricopeptide (TPR) repeat protein [Rhodoligotrophos appendicifer]|uniref:hypothetical protein n=1 Tax=Rhodoligotrophos appendicifer TaxID=987056 RepID=UPI001186EB33|nr:hypothetical protein [Rhodoligotrophos appendicifer]
MAILPRKRAGSASRTSAVAGAVRSLPAIMRSEYLYRAARKISADGDHARAAEKLQSHLPRLREHAHWRAFTLLGHCHAELGDLHAARDFFAEAAALILTDRKLSHSSKSYMSHYIDNHFHDEHVFPKEFKSTAFLLINKEKLPQDVVSDFPVEHAEIRSRLGMRMNVGLYRSLPDQERTAFVTGMADMLSNLYHYVGDEDRALFGRMIAQEAPLDGTGLRQEFDAHLEAAQPAADTGTARSFVEMLMHKQLHPRLHGDDHRGR